MADDNPQPTTTVPFSLHPSPQLHDFSLYLVAWGALVLGLVALAAYSGKTAVGSALGIGLAALLVYTARTRPTT